MTSRADRLKNTPASGLSPATRQSIRERAEAAALREVEKERANQREKTERLRKLRLDRSARKSEN